MAYMSRLISRPPDGKLAFDFVHYPTEYLRKLLVEAGIESKRWCRIPWGVDTELFHPAETLPQGKLLYVGQVSPHKGVHLAIEAVGILKARNPTLPIQLTVAGRCVSASYEAELKDLAMRYDLNENISFIGFVAREDLPELYRRHAILLFPSVWEEPMGITVLEAMASGLVVISSGSGGGRELFEDGISGLLFRSEDPGDLAGKLIMVLQNGAVLSEIGFCAMKSCNRKYNFANTTTQIKNHLINYTLSLP